jgi:hypothetical protein
MYTLESPPVSTGTIAAVLAEAPERVSPAVEAIGERLAAAEVVCFDETGMRAAGKLHWARMRRPLTG